MFSLDFDQDLKIKGRIGTTENEEFNFELREINSSIKSIGDLRQVFHLCQKYKYEYSMYIADNLILLSVHTPKGIVTLEYKTKDELFSILTN